VSALPKCQIPKWLQPWAERSKAWIKTPCGWLGCALVVILIAWAAKPVGKDWVDVLRALATPAIAYLGYSIAKGSLNVQNKKRNDDLFDRRLSTYKKLSNAPQQLLQNTKASMPILFSDVHSLMVARSDSTIYREIDDNIFQVYFALVSHGKGDDWFNELKDSDKVKITRLSNCYMNELRSHRRQLDNEIKFLFGIKEGIMGKEFKVKSDSKKKDFHSTTLDIFKSYRMVTSDPRVTEKLELAP
jgi:hypothetical protein